MACGPSVLDAVDESLGMFHPEANGEGFRLQGHPGTLEHPKCVPCAIPQGQEEEGRSDLISFVDNDSLKVILEYFQPRYLGLDLEFHALRLKVLAQGENDPPEAIRADMGSLKKKDFSRGSEAMKSFQDGGNAGVTQTGIEFSV
jgi:hypothetical protein